MNNISSTEYRQRMSAIQKEMTLRELDLLLVYSWKRGPVRYISGYYPNYIANVALVILPRQGEPALRIRFPFDLERAQRESWLDDVAASGNVLPLAQAAASYVTERGIKPTRIGLVTGDNVMDELPYTLYGELEKVFPKVNFSDERDIFRKMRLIKSEDEFALLRQSARLADTGIQAARDALQVGVSEYEVVAAAESQLRRQGSNNYLVVIASKGERELIGPPEHKKIETGDNVIFELAVEYNGYWTQAVQVLYVGGGTPEQHKIYRATYQAYLDAMQAALPGKTCEEVARVAQASLEAAGFGDYIEQDYGHGIGLDLPEPPRIETGDLTTIEPGMVLVIHPAVRVPGVGGAFVGGTVLVHEKGAEPIHEISPQPFDVGI
jgi:Xaa-Pro dipeptidase